MRLGFKLDVVVEVPEGANEELTIQGVKDFLSDTDRDALFIGQVFISEGHEASGEDGLPIEVVTAELDEENGWHSVNEGDLPSDPVDNQ